MTSLDCRAFLSGYWIFCNDFCNHFIAAGDSITQALHFLHEAPWGITPRWVQIRIICCWAYFLLLLSIWQNKWRHRGGMRQFKISFSSFSFSFILNIILANCQKGNFLLKSDFIMLLCHKNYECSLLVNLSC